MALGGEPTREHEDYAIVSINPMPKEVQHLCPTLNVVCHFLEQNHRVHVDAAHLSPLDLRLIKLHTVAQQDQLVRESLSIWVTVLSEWLSMMRDLMLDHALTLGNVG
jgi:hypothetical protein